MNMTCKCFKCGAEYGSDNPDDQAGDGRCPSCKEMARQIAFKVDVEIGEKRRHDPIVRTERAEMIQQLLQKGGSVSMRDLGITPRG